MKYLLHCFLTTGRKLLGADVLTASCSGQETNRDGSRKRGGGLGICDPVQPKNIFSLLMAVVGWAACGACYADTIIGGPSAGFQTWTAADLNNNMAPYWDYPTNYTFAPFNNGNVGFCLTTGCAGQLSPGPAPGAIPFWGLSYDSATDTGGGLDPNFFFQRTSPKPLNATLEVSLATNPRETNSFGWVETDSLGNILGPLHPLFSISDTPGAAATFQPTQFYAYYFHDISEAGLNDSSGNCLAFTVSSSNTSPCGSSGLFHDMAAFATNPSSPLTSFWVAGLNAVAECNPSDGADCNLTLVQVSPTIPEPATWTLMAIGFASLGLFRAAKAKWSSSRFKLQR
jgi:hypothetical protein